MSNQESNPPLLDPASIPDARIVARSPTPKLATPAKADAAEAKTPREAELEGQVAELSGKLDGLIAGLAAGGKINPTRIQKSMPEPQFGMVKIYVPKACYINGKEYLGEVECSENVALSIQSMLSRRKEHDTRLTEAKSPVSYEVGAIVQTRAKKILPDVV